MATSYLTVQSFRCLNLSAIQYGKRNFRKFLLHNKRGTKLFKKTQAEQEDPDIPIYHYGVRPTGYKKGNEFIVVPEMIPELMVPDLTDFKLKPYVSYAAPDVVQSEFTARDLFNAVYRKKVTEDFKNGKLDSNGESLEPSSEEAMTAEEAYNKARSVGNDICGEVANNAKE